MMIKAFSKDSAKFNADGLILSEERCFETGGIVQALGPHVTSLEYFENLFLFNQHRRDLYKNFKKWFCAYNDNGGRVVCSWFGGSFIENVAYPSDIDCTIFTHNKNLLVDDHWTLNRHTLASEMHLDIKKISLSGNPLNILHVAVQANCYYSIPSGAKKAASMCHERKAIISVTGEELNGLQSGKGRE